MPKRIRALGWTINWAHPQAIPMLLLMLGIAVGPALVVIAITLVLSMTPTGLGPTGIWLSVFGPFAAVGVSLIAIIRLSMRLARGA